MNRSDGGRVVAVLGPTNTGKTHYAIERMLGHRTGVIGLPLRLLAREVYDKIVALRGPSVVALVTGEERIVPARTQYWVCTVEAMPVSLGTEFLAVDEIQLCADPDRGHVFTDRLLHARGLSETLFLGAQNMGARIASLVPEAYFARRERFSKLSYAGRRKISRMPPRSAIVGFSVDNVYAIAELLRRQKGGAAVVMGALSPRTRNAQVDLYQNGDVDYLVATDAIGMGLNLDIGHVAFSGLAKFDGRRHRVLAANELAQIAGRAGRFTTDGTFGVTGEAPELREELVDAIESHRFAPIRRLEWRNSRLEFGTADALIASLELPSGQSELAPAREADDLATLRALWALPEIHDRVAGGGDVRLLWDVCQLPDFRKVSGSEHAGLCTHLFGFLHGGGRVPTDWLAGHIAGIDRVEGDIDALSARLAHVRTWTYVAQRKDWVDDVDHWRNEARAVEDRLSDALHARLTQRFVDRRTSVLMRRLKQKESLVAEVNDKGDVTIEGQFVGRLEGFRFIQDATATADEAKTLRAAALAALQPAYRLKADRMYNAPDTEIDVTEQGGLMWGSDAIGKLVAGADALSPQIEGFVDEEAGADVADKVVRRLTHWLNRQLDAKFEGLIALKDDESLSGLARGIAFRLVEAMGVLPRSDVAADVKSLDQEQRGTLRKHGVRFGQYTIFQPAMLKPAPTRLRLVLASLAEGLEDFPSAPPPGLVTVPAVKDAPLSYYARAGYRLAGERAIRIDMLERLADMVRGTDTRGGFEATADMLSITGLTLEQFANLMEGLGYKAERGEREKVKLVPESKADAPAETPEAPAQGAEAAKETAPEAEAETMKETAPEAEAAKPEADAGAGQAEAEAETVADEATPVDAGAKPEAEEAKPEAEEVKPEVVEAKPEVEAASPEAEETKPAEQEAKPEAEATATDAAPEEPVVEVFYTFTWAPKPRAARPRNDARAKPAGKPRQKGRGPKPGGKDDQKKSFTARPPRKDKPIDPDNPFAALMALKEKG